MRRVALCVVVMACLCEAADDDEWHNVRAHDDLENSVKETTNAVEDKLHNLQQTVHNTAQEFNNSMQAVKSESENAVDALKACTNELQCNNRGTCMGTAQTYLCLCNLGYSGQNCQETLCESARDCNGRGLCIGTTTQLTCLCNLGYTGKHCETKAP